MGRTERCGHDCLQVLERLPAGGPYALVVAHLVRNGSVICLCPRAYMEPAARLHAVHHGQCDYQMAVCAERLALALFRVGARMGRGCHLVFITFTRLFFRSGSNLDPAIANETAWRIATEMVNQMGTAWNANVGDIILAYDKVFALFALGMVIHWLPDNWKRRYRIWFARMPLPLMAAVVVLTVFIAYQFVTAEMQPFIYFQF